MGGALVTKRVVSYCQRIARFAIQFTVKAVYQLYIANKTKRISFISGHAEAYKRRLAYSVTVIILP